MSSSLGCKHCHPAASSRASYKNIIPKYSSSPVLPKSSQRLPSWALPALHHHHPQQPHGRVAGSLSEAYPLLSPSPSYHRWRNVAHSTPPLHATGQQASQQSTEGPYKAVRSSQAKDAGSIQGTAGIQEDDGIEGSDFADQEEGELLFDLDGSWDEDLESDGEMGEAGEGEEDEDREVDDAALLGLESDDSIPGIETGNVPWAETALKAVQKVLSTPAMSNIKLYMYRAFPVTSKLDIRLDRLDDPYGSPSIDDIEKFSRMLFLALDAALGVEAAGQIALEVSSPGAERILNLPEDLRRFGALPLRVEYKGQDDQPVTQALDLVEFDEASGLTQWRLADVRANSTVKGRSLSKRQKAMVLEIPLQNITRARVFVDF